MTRILTPLFGIVAALLFHASADAQMVRVGAFGGVSIRVPFASVDVLPFGGGTRVRAPFTSVNTRAFAAYPYAAVPYRYYPRPYVAYPIYGRAYAVPVNPVPRYPSYGVTPAVPRYQVARPQVVAPSSAVSSPAVSSTGDPTDQLRRAATRLAGRLALRRDDGDVWLEYLGPQRIIETIDQGGSMASLADLLVNFNAVVNSGNRSIVNADGFRTTHALLGQLVNSADPSPKDVPPVSEGTDIEAEPKADSFEPRDTSVPTTPSPTAPAPDEPTPAAPVQPADADAEADQPGSLPEVEEIPIPTPL